MEAQEEGNSGTEEGNCGTEEAMVNQDVGNGGSYLKGYWFEGKD